MARIARHVDVSQRAHRFGSPMLVVPPGAGLTFGPRCLRVRTGVPAARASQPVLTEAEHLLSHITDQYFSRNLTVQELRQLAHSARADPLKAVSEACRAELKSIRARL